MALSTKVLIRASRIKAAVRGEGLLVFATADRALLRTANVSKAIAKAEHSTFKCADCKTTIIASSQNSPEPFCVVCGSHHVTKRSEQANPKVPSDDRMLALTCGQCKTANVLPVVAAATTNGHIHCITCGTDIQAGDTDLTSLDGAGSPAATLNTPEIKGLEEVNAEDLEEDLDPELPADETADGEEEGDEALDDVADDLESADDLEGLELEESLLDTEDEFGEGDEELADFEVLDETVGDGEAFVPPSSTAESDGEGLTEEDDGSELSADDLEGGDPSLDSELETVPELEQGEDLIDTVQVDDTAVALTLATVGNKLVAMKGHYSIATLNKVTAGTNADIMFSPSFKEAVMIQARKHGVKKALKAFGFKFIKTPASSKASVIAAVAKADEKATAQRAEFNRVWAESLAIASVGLNRGIWKSHQNALRAALETELLNLGVRSPKRVTARVFADNGLPYTQTLIELANKIASMSSTARKEYAEMLDMTDESEEADSHTDEMPNNDYEGESEDVLSDVQSRFAVPARSIESATFLRPRADTQVKALSTASAILNGEAKLKFSSV